MKILNILIFVMITVCAYSTESESKELILARKSFNQELERVKSNYIKNLESLKIRFQMKNDYKMITQIKNEIRSVNETQLKFITSTMNDIIIAGVGWKNFRVGATKKELTEFLGEPDKNSESAWLRWQARHIHCTYSDFHNAQELRFNKGFPYATKLGIHIGAREEEVKKIYGKPDYPFENKNAKKLQYSEKGILFWTWDGVVSQIVVFKPFTWQK